MSNFVRIVNLSQGIALRMAISLLIGLFVMPAAALAPEQVCGAFVSGLSPNGPPQIENLPFNQSKFKINELPRPFYRGDDGKIELLSPGEYLIELAGKSEKIAPQLTRRPKTVFNPLSGPDLLTSATLFPDAEIYVLSGAESFTGLDDDLSTGAVVASNFYQTKVLPTYSSSSILASVITLGGTVNWVARVRLPGIAGTHGAISYRKDGRDVLVLYLNIRLEDPTSAASFAEQFENVYPGSLNRKGFDAVKAWFKNLWKRPSGRETLAREIWWAGILDSLKPEAFVLKASQSVFRGSIVWGAASGRLTQKGHSYWAGAMRFWLCRYRPTLITQTGWDGSARSKEVDDEVVREGLVWSEKFKLGFGYGPGAEIGLIDSAKLNCP